jgi:hypothetical protein
MNDPLGSNHRYAQQHGPRPRANHPHLAHHSGALTPRSSAPNSGTARVLATLSITQRDAPSRRSRSGVTGLEVVVGELPVNAAGERRGRSGKISPDRARALCGKVVRLRCRAVMNGHARVPGLMATDRCLAERSLCACPGAVPYSSWGCGGACWAELQRGCSGRFPPWCLPPHRASAGHRARAALRWGVLCSCGAWFGDGPHRGPC